MNGRLSHNLLIATQEFLLPAFLPSFFESLQVELVGGPGTLIAFRGVLPVHRETTK